MMSDEEGRVQFDIQYRDVSVTFVLPSHDDHISKVLMSTRSFYELPMLEAIAPALKPGDLVVDAGANIGNHTIFFAKVLGCRVMAFEAIPTTAALLEQNVSRNGLSDLVQVHAVALGEKSGSAMLARYDLGNVGGSMLVADVHGDIPVRFLDSVPRDGPVRLLKVDVEGMDLAVLKGARGILADDRPWVVCEAGDESVYRPIVEYMDRMGYSPTAVYNATDTFLFLPSRSEAERKQLVEQAFVQMMAMQREEMKIAARLEQAGRYSERMKKEALAEVAARFETWSEQQAESEQTPYTKALAAIRVELGDANVAVIVEREQAAAQLALAKHQSRLEMAAIERQLDAKSADLVDARAALYAQREQAATQLTDAQGRADEGRKEIALLLEGAAQARKVLEQQRASLSSLTVTLAREQAARETQTKDLSEKLIKHNGLLARSERELADKQRRIVDAHRVLRVRTQRVSELEQQLAEIVRVHGLDKQSLAATHDALRELQASLSLKLGVLIVSSMHSPLRAFTLLWRLPALVWREWRHRASSKKSLDDRS